MPYVEFVYFVLIGLFSGFFGGLLGIGGGVVIVPFLLITLNFLHITFAEQMQHVVATSLACMAVTSIIATWFHHKKEAVIWRVLKSIFPGVIVGSIFGAYSAHLVSSSNLIRAFGIFMIILSFYFFTKKPSNIPDKRQVHRGSIQSLMGTVISFLSSLLGIGGGTFFVPFFLSYRMPIKNAIATSSVCTFLTSFIGTIAYMILGWNEIQIAWTFGYVYLPAFFFISLGVIFSTPIGVKLTHKLSSQVLKIIFSILLFIIGILMVIR